MLAKCILANPPRGGRSHWRDTLKLVQARIQRWKEGDLPGLWVEASSSIKGHRSRSARSKSKPTSSESLHVGLPPRVIPSPFPKACYFLMERERNSLDTSLSTTCSRGRRDCLLCMLVSVFSLCLPCPALCFDLSVVFCLYFCLFSHLFFFFHFAQRAPRT